MAADPGPSSRLSTRKGSLEVRLGEGKMPGSWGGRRRPTSALAHDCHLGLLPIGSGGHVRCATDTDLRAQQVPPLSVFAQICRLMRDD